MRARRLRTVRVGAALALTLMAEAPSASAHYCRTTTVKTIADYDPAAPGEGCWSEGLPLYWGSGCISYDLQKNGGPNITYGEASAAIATAFALWTSSPCPEGTGQASITVSDLGAVSCDRVEYNECGPNQHVILFRDTWPYEDTANTLALTTVSYDIDTGELYDADMEINASKPLSLVSPVPAGSYDFASVVTHETGHFLGLAHATTSSETMYAFFDPGETRRSLSTDDVDGLCTIYPPNGTRSVVTDAGPAFIDAAACDPTPRHGFTTECMPTPVDGGVACEPPPSGGGCAVGGGSSEGATMWLVLMGVCARARRRRQVPTRPSGA